MPASRRSLAERLDVATARINRMAPPAAAAAFESGARLIDIRGHAERARDGVVPGALPIPRSVLEWRLDPDSDFARPDRPGFDEVVIVLCDHGYSSVFAAESLFELGYLRAGDVIGGFEAWSAAGLPLLPGPLSALRGGALPGYAPPDGWRSADIVARASR